MTTSTTSTSFADYRKRIAKSKMPFLGELIAYSVTEAVLIDHAKFVKACETHGLGKYSPKLPKDVDVFRRACTAAQRKRVPLGHGIYGNYMIRDVRSAAGHFWKQLVIEHVDGENRSLEYTSMVEFEFDPDVPDTIHVTKMEKVDAETRTVIEQINDNYTSWRGKVHAYSTREFLRAVIGGAKATVWKDGTYFVPQSQLDIIEALDALITEVKRPDDIRLLNMPLIDDARQKEMLRASFEDEAVKQIEDFVAECKEAIADDKMTDRRFAALAFRRKEIEARVDEYTTLLDDNLEGTKLRLKGIETQMKRAFKASR